ncbi:29728_t:CDS:2, partial [Racocetra persica]
MESSNTIVQNVEHFFDTLNFATLESDHSDLDGSIYEDSLPEELDSELSEIDATEQEFEEINQVNDNDQMAKQVKASNIDQESLPATESSEHETMEVGSGSRLPREVEKRERSASTSKVVRCKASQLHSWWENRELLLNIKKAYDDGGHTSGYYKWFLKNEYLLQDLRKYEGKKSRETLTDKMISLVKPYLSEHDQAVPSSSLPESKRHICIFYLMILQGFLPRIEQPHWIDFGFCACKVGDNYRRDGIINNMHNPILSARNCELAEEARLQYLYQDLIVQKGCKIDEFNDAYISGTVLDLIKRKCDKTYTSWLSASKIETFGYNQPVKSVYNLKQYILSNSVNMIPAIRDDYGFRN